MRTRAAVMSDQSPEGDWVDVGGGDSEESHADLFLASVLNSARKLKIWKCTRHLTSFRNVSKISTHTIFELVKNKYLMK